MGRARRSPWHARRVSKRDIERATMCRESWWTATTRDKFCELRQARQTAMRWNRFGKPEARDLGGRSSMLPPGFRLKFVPNGEP